MRAASVLRTPSRSGAAVLIKVKYTSPDGTVYAFTDAQDKPAIAEFRDGKCIRVLHFDDIREAIACYNDMVDEASDGRIFTGLRRRAVLEGYSMKTGKKVSV